VFRDAHKNCIRELIVVPDLCYLISCAFDGRIAVWDYTVYNEETEQPGKLVTDFRCVRCVSCTCP